MRFRYLLVLLCLLATDAGADDDPLADLKKDQPRDVKELIDRLAYCAHWSGEEPYDAEHSQAAGKRLLSGVGDRFVHEALQLWEKGADLRPRPIIPRRAALWMTLPSWHDQLRK